MPIKNLKKAVVLNKLIIEKVIEIDPSKFANKNLNNVDDIDWLNKFYETKEARYSQNLPFSFPWNDKDFISKEYFETNLPVITGFADTDLGNITGAGKIAIVDAVRHPDTPLDTNWSIDDLGGSDLASVDYVNAKFGKWTEIGIPSGNTWIFPDTGKIPVSGKKYKITYRLFTTDGSEQETPPFTYKGARSGEGITMNTWWFNGLLGALPDVLQLRFSDAGCDFNMRKGSIPAPNNQSKVISVQEWTPPTK